MTAKAMTTTTLPTASFFPPPPLLGMDLGGSCRTRREIRRWILDSILRSLMPFDVVLGSKSAGQGTDVIEMEGR
eukprot:CAMPEP_0175076350 /NCGR_PEP_ID=MMETSP0052_2-20121109/22668_1 /TAXON_ID=51329 ORGANISM="Polytomella parva, Strain SAG 63-3" /NCGR_SAMPLE_ID=MMETSP0052_2 /ASSEMBLY_ACC=CAM_ASM_000194 /LENGTH=73 /DNA_ID=CAMNT_0016345459 /DNA_START=216 /DNA_END=437 /DNA_ORIENTATION=-